MLFKYIGNGKDSPETTTVYGATFELNEVLEVTDPKAILKLRGNPTFSCIEDETAEEPMETVDKPKNKVGRPKK